MALLTCRKCGGKYASSWGQCPSCSLGKSGSIANRKTQLLTIRVVYFIAIGIFALGAFDLLRGGLPSMGQDLGRAPFLMLTGVVTYSVARVADFFVRRR